MEPSFVRRHEAVTGRIAATHPVTPTEAQKTYRPRGGFVRVST